MNDPTRNVYEDTDGAFYVGVGVKYRAGARWGLRADARLLVVPSSENNPPPSPTTSKVTLDFEALASFYVELGREEVKVAKAAAGRRRSGQGRHPRRADKCPTEPEDKDGFQDDDGCPELDNDGDGIPDAADKCPNEPEDKDGFQDDDGCPEPDNDGDGIPDASDKLPERARGQGRLRGRRRLPRSGQRRRRRPRRGRQVPERARDQERLRGRRRLPRRDPGEDQEVHGRDPGHQLPRRLGATCSRPRTGRSTRRSPCSRSSRTLKLEIQGHTDDVPIKKGKKFADNLELSQARAESVRAYFIKKGIDESRLSAKGFGDTMPVTDRASSRAAS